MWYCHIWDTTVNSTQHTANYKVVLYTYVKRNNASHFFSYTFQFCLVILQLLQGLPLMQHPLTSLLPFFFFFKLRVNMSSKRELDKMIIWKRWALEPYMGHTKHTKIQKRHKKGLLKGKLLYLSMIFSTIKTEMPFLGGHSSLVFFHFN